jgi:hypothetical protein
MNDAADPRPIGLEFRRNGPRAVAMPAVTGCRQEGARPGSGPRRRATRGVRPGDPSRRTAATLRPARRGHSGTGIPKKLGGFPGKWRGTPPGRGQRRTGFSIDQAGGELPSPTPLCPNSGARENGSPSPSLVGSEGQVRRGHESLEYPRRTHEMSGSSPGGPVARRDPGRHRVQPRHKRPTTAAGRPHSARYAGRHGRVAEDSSTYRNQPGTRSSGVGAGAITCGDSRGSRGPQESGNPDR